MRSLQEITDAVRRNAPATDEELRAAIVAYDVFLAQIKIEERADILTEFFRATNGDPRDYYGPANDPNDPDVSAWHNAFVNIGIPKE